MCDAPILRPDVDVGLAFSQINPHPAPKRARHMCAPAQQCQISITQYIIKFWLLFLKDRVVNLAGIALNEDDQQLYPLICFEPPSGYILQTAIISASSMVLEIAGWQSKCSICGNEFVYMDRIIAVGSCRVFNWPLYVIPPYAPPV